MKKFRILSLVLIVVMLVGMLAGCSDTVKKKDLEADPQGYIEEALKKSLAKSPFGGILALEDADATSVGFEINPVEEGIGSLKANVVFDNEKLSVLAELTADQYGEKLNGSVFVDEKNFAIKMAELKDLFGSEAIGVGLKDFEKNFKESAWYKMLIIDTGLEEELKAEGVDKLDIGAIFGAYEEFLKSIEDIAESCREFAIEETEIEIDGKKVACYAVTETMSDDAASKMGHAMKKWVNDILKAVNAPEDAKEDIDVYDTIDEMTRFVEEIARGEKTTYYIAKNGGALVKVDSNTRIDVSRIDSKEDTVISYDTVVEFGADPENWFEPDFKIVTDDGSSKTTMIGKSTIDTKAKTFNLVIDGNLKSYNEKLPLDKNLKIDLVMNEDGKYTFNLANEEDEINLNGKFKVDGSEMTFTVGPAELETSGIKDIKIIVDFDADAPESFEYDDLMKWDEAKIAELIGKIAPAGSTSEGDYDSGE